MRIRARSQQLGFYSIIMLYPLACCMWSKARDWSLPIVLFLAFSLHQHMHCHDAAICDSTVSMYHTQRRISLSCSGHSPWKRAVAGVAMFVFQQRRARMHECAHSAIPYYTHVCQRKLFLVKWKVGLFHYSCVLDGDARTLRSYCRFFGIRHIYHICVCVCVCMYVCMYVCMVLCLHEATRR